MGHNGGYVGLNPLHDPAGKRYATYGDLSSSNRCKLMRSEGHLEYPFQSKTFATRGASEVNVVDLSDPAKGR